MIKNILFLLSLLYASYGYCVLEVIVLKGDKDAIPIAVLPFYINNSDKKSNIADVIRNDLTVSGYFLAKNDDFIKNSKAVFKQVNYSKWQEAKVEILIFGDVEDNGGNFVTVSVYVYEVYSQQAILAHRYKTSKLAKRKTAHQISDKIYEAVLGVRGSFDTYLTYIEVNDDTLGERQYKIKISDSDGFNSQILFSSSEPLMSPVWSPDNSRIAYVSFENGHSEIFIKHPFSRRKTVRLPTFDGIASAPSWHPDGDKLVLTLSKKGNKDIYIYHLKTKKLKRITSHKSIDTEGSFSPDGKELVFTSNRNGKAQVYVKNLDNNKIKRISFRGYYNVNAHFSPNGQYLVMLNADKGKYHIILFDLRNDEWIIMTDNTLDETPYFSPNGRMIIYSTNLKEKGVLSVISIDGLRSHYLSSKLGNVRDPNWSNFLTFK